MLVCGARKAATAFTREKMQVSSNAGMAVDA